MLADALANAKNFGAQVEVISTAELDDPRYSQQPGQPLLLLQTGAFHQNAQDGCRSRIQHSSLRRKCG